MKRLSEKTLSAALKNHDHKGVQYWVAFVPSGFHLYKRCVDAVRTGYQVNEMQECCIERLQELTGSDIYKADEDVWQLA